jgi:hypothetical protein
MRRLANWRAPLAAEFLAARTRTFAWGTFDCAMFACDCARIQTGNVVDPGVAFRGKYSTEAQADVFIQQAGSLQQIASQTAANCGFAEVSTGHAQRGDLVFIDNNTPAGALAVVDFTGMYAVCPAATGLMRVRRHRWKRVWRVA